MRNIFLIVITGGPCAGKTTAMNYLRQKLQEYGYVVIVVSEAATEFITGGITPALVGDAEFQRQLLQYILERQKRYIAAAKAIQGEDIVILFDRAGMDNAAYVPKSTFQEIIVGLDLSIVDLRDSFNGVVFLRTIAADRPELYTTANNAARRETREEAVDLDMRTHNVWVGAPHFAVIGNKSDMKGKAHAVLEEVCRIIGEPVPLEIERKYLLTQADLSLLPYHVQPIDIEQTYLASEPGQVERVRKRGQDGSFVFFHTIKEPVAPGVRKEIETAIEQGTYMQLLTRADPSCGTVAKTRHCFTWQDQRFELDIFKRPEGLILLELELTREDQEVILPDMLRPYATNVTDDPAYSNYAIARSLVA